MSQSMWIGPLAVIILSLAALLNASALAQGVVGEFVPDIGVDLSGQLESTASRGFPGAHSRPRTGQLFRPSYYRKLAPVG